MAESVWLNVPYSENDDAKRLGARWDPKTRHWYAPAGKVEALARWLPAPDVPTLLPGEDRTFGAGLFVDLVPSSCWFTNVRSCIDKQDWERVRHMVLGRAGSRCEACQRPEDRTIKRWLEVHERWEFNDQTLTQTLRRLICLCTDCHSATHFGLARVLGRETQAVEHLMWVRGESPAAVSAHVAAAFNAWLTRSELTWTLDLSILTNSGVSLRNAPEAKDRPNVAVTMLSRTNQLAQEVVGVDSEARTSGLAQAPKPSGLHRTLPRSPAKPQ